jgi:hypothetical protein
MGQEVTLSSELKELFEVIKTEITWLHTIWELYIQLFGTSDKNFEIMNSSAPFFFRSQKKNLMN